MSSKRNVLFPFNSFVSERIILQQNIGNLETRIVKFVNYENAVIGKREYLENVCNPKNCSTLSIQTFNAFTINCSFKYYDLANRIYISWTVCCETNCIKYAAQLENTSMFTKWKTSFLFVSIRVYCKLQFVISNSFLAMGNTPNCG